MENTLLQLRSPARPVYQLQTANHGARLTVGRVLYDRFLRWLSKASPQAIWKIIRWGLTSLLGSFLWFMPEPTFRLLLNLAVWNGSKIPLFLIGCYCLLNVKRAYLWLKRRRVRVRGSNQHTFHGLPVGEFASFLKKHEAFKFADATKELALTRDQYDTIAEDLEKHGVLTRGEKNARVLRPIGMTLLVAQLRDDFPYVWDDETDTWNEKNGTFARWCMNRDFEQKKLTAQVEKKERQLERIEKKIEAAEEHPLWSQLAV